MMKFFLSLFLLVFLASATLTAQHKVTGKVTDESGDPIPGVNVIEKENSTNGTTTDVEGVYTLEAGNNQSTLTFSFIGYKQQSIAIAGQPVVDVTLEADVTGLDEVVVTALGIRREEKSLAYSTQQVKGEELTAVRTDNMIKALAGKASGVVVSPGTSGVGGSSRVILRGYTSIQGNNQPLYVVDGIPLQNYIPNQSETGNGFGGGIDAGDGISNLSPDDIESMNILKGASAAALYGSQAANGVIIITTRSGREGKTAINLTSSFQADKANVLYKWQDRYGAKGTSSWGEKSSKSFGNNNGPNLFQTGANITNTLSLSGGTKTSKNYISFSNTMASGIVPTNKLEKYNFSIRNTSDFFKGVLNLDSKVNLMQQEIDNAPSAPGEYFNPIRAAFLMPVNDDLLSYKNNYTAYDKERNMMAQNWKYIDKHQNPYWIFNRNATTSSRSRIIANVAATINLVKGLDIKARGNIDKTYDNFERKVYAGTKLTISHLNGRYEFYHKNNTQLYGDILVTYRKQWKDLSLLATVGTSVTYVVLKAKGADSDIGGLNIPNLFSFTNMTNGGAKRTHELVRSQLQSYFGTASLGYKNFAYLDVTARRDQSSTLPPKNNTYFYPSIGGSLLINEIINKKAGAPALLNYTKVRASYSEVGNDVEPYKFNPHNTVNEVGTVIRNTVEPNPDLEPERTSAYEFGLETRMLRDKVRFDITYYNTITKNQYFEIDANVGSGYSKKMINGGIIVNKGVELALGLTPIKANNLTWNTDINFSTNKSKVEELPSGLIEGEDEPDYFDLDANGYKLRVVEGGEFGEIWGSRYKRKDGKLVVTRDKDGVVKPVISSAEEIEKLGSINPDFRLSWANNIRYKNLSLNFLIDGSFGGIVVSNTQGLMNRYGVSKETGDARDNSGVDVDAFFVDENDKIVDTYKGKITAKNYYSGMPDAECTYDATNVRLRELSLRYSLPKSLVQKTGFIKDAGISLVGRNLFFFYIKAPYDPEGAQNTRDNHTFNSDRFGVPVTRSIGASLNLKF